MCRESFSLYFYFLLYIFKNVFFKYGARNVDLGGQPPRFASSPPHWPTGNFEILLFVPPPACATPPPLREREHGFKQLIVHFFLYDVLCFCLKADAAA